MRKTLTALVAGIALGTAGCESTEVERDWYCLRGGIDVQVYNIRNVKTPFKTPNINDRWNLAPYIGAEVAPLSTENTRLYVGIDGRLNFEDALEDNRKANRDCQEHGKVSIIGQGAGTAVPFAGIRQNILGVPVFAEVGFPYTRWDVGTGDTFGPGCFDNVRKQHDTGFGQSLRLGASPGAGVNLSVGYERHRNDVIDVDAWTIGVMMRF